MSGDVCSGKEWGVGNYWRHWGNNEIEMKPFSTLHLFVKAFWLARCETRGSQGLYHKGFRISD